MTPPRALAVALVLPTLLLAAREASGEITWTLETNAAYGPRFEATRREPTVFARERNDVAGAFSTGIRVGGIASPGILLFADVRTPVPALEGQLGAGLGVGYAPRVGEATSIVAALQGGFAQLHHGACECGGLEYDGPWLRAELGARYGLLASLGRGLVRRKPTPAFDLHLSVALAVDAVLARYPEGSPSGEHEGDTGLRLGFDPMVGLGFVW